MKAPLFLRHIVWMSVVPLLLGSCKEKPTVVEIPAEEEISPLVQADTPVLDIREGHRWRYRVTVENPNDIRTSGPVQASFETERRYIGKVSPQEGKEGDCFEVMVPGRKARREFVKIEPGSLSILGQSGTGESTTDGLVWMNQPVPYFRAGLQAGDSLPLTVFDKNEKHWRTVRVIARETVIVPAGEFEAVRLQMLGRDGDLTLRKTYWFCPGVGVVREETVKEVDGKPVMVTNEELLEQTPGEG